jgi:hypothetical protein
VAKSVNALFVMLIVEPLVIKRPMPRSAVSVASVMMNGGSPILVMPNAWNTPIARPTASVIRMASHTATPPWISIAITTVENPAIAPTLRSMPAVMITNVSPSARTAIIDPCRNRFGMLRSVRKFGVAKLSISHSRRSRPSSVSANRKL